MNHPAEEAASHAVSSGGLATFAKLTAGFGLTIADLNAWLTLAGGLFTVVYGMLKIWDWFEDRKRKRQDWRERDELRASERQTMSALYRKLESRWTKPAELDTASGHDNGAGR